MNDRDPLLDRRTQSGTKPVNVRRLMVAVFAMAVLLVTIYVSRHIQGDPVERERLNPELRPNPTAPAP